MRCVPTCAVMDEGDPELAWARQHLRERLSLMARHLIGAADAMPQIDHAVPWNVLQWRYLGSAPWREDDSTIVYVHGFRHATMVLAGEPPMVTWLFHSGLSTVPRVNQAPAATASRAPNNAVCLALAIMRRKPPTNTATPGKTSSHSRPVL